MATKTTYYSDGFFTGGGSCAVCDLSGCGWEDESSPTLDGLGGNWRAVANSLWHRTFENAIQPTPLSPFPQPNGFALWGTPAAAVTSSVTSYISGFLNISLLSEPTHGAPTDFGAVAAVQPGYDFSGLPDCYVARVVPASGFGSFNSELWKIVSGDATRLAFHVITPTSDVLAIAPQIQAGATGANNIIVTCYWMQSEGDYDSAYSDVLAYNDPELLPLANTLFGMYGAPTDVVFFQAWVVFQPVVHPVHGCVDQATGILRPALTYTFGEGVPLSIDVNGALVGQAGAVFTRLNDDVIAVSTG